jgi:hypothetical protein
MLARWAADGSRAVDSATVTRMLAEVAAATNEPVIVVLEGHRAELTIVVGDPAGTVLTYYPPGYVETGVGSLHSVGDPDAAAADAWEPPLTAFFLGHHTEFPRWSVVAHEVGETAAVQFCERPSEPPRSVQWEAD